MDVTTQNSDCSCCQELHHAFSFKRCCFFLFIFIVLLVTAVGVATLIVIFSLKPQKPVFSLETIRVDSYKLNIHSNSTLFFSSVASLILNAQNPNKFGIKYDPSRFHVYRKGLPIGVIQVPGFRQEAHSNNMSVALRVLIHCVNVSQIIAEALTQDERRKNIVQMKILGDTRVHLQLFPITLPQIKVALDCDINFDYRDLTFKNEVSTTRVQDHVVSIPTNSKSFSKKCSLAIYI